MTVFARRVPNPWAGDDTVQAEIVPSQDGVDNPMVPPSTGLRQALGNDKAQWLRAIRRSQGLNMLLGGATLALTGACIWLSMQVQILPYVIEVAESGQVRGIRPLPSGPDRQLTDNVAIWFLELWIKQCRLLHDRAASQAQYHNWELVYNLTEQTMYPRLDTHMQEQLKRIQHGETVEIRDIKSLLPIHAKERSYQAEWVEKVYGMGGHLLREELWQATLVLSYRAPGPMTPNEMEVWHRNPSGLFVHEFSWRGKELPKKEKGSLHDQTHP
jgi:type IV secretory pathway TrbF-like protein